MGAEPTARNADHRDRRTVGRGQGNDRARRRGTPAIPARRHRRHVPRCRLEGARATGRSRRRGSASPRERARAFRPGERAGSASTDRTCRRRFARRRSTPRRRPWRGIPRPARAHRPAAGARPRRRRRHGRPRHRHGRVSRCRREDLPRRVARGTRAPPRHRSGASQLAPARPSRRSRPHSPSAIAATRPARRRRCRWRPTPSSSRRPAWRSSRSSSASWRSCDERRHSRRRETHVDPLTGVRAPEEESRLRRHASNP